MIDHSFKPNHSDLLLALETLKKSFQPPKCVNLPELFPSDGLGELDTLATLAPVVLGGAAKLGDTLSFAHMDPPTPWITWITALWNASLNQNLLHPDVSPVARNFEERAIEWLCPYFGMDGGQLTPGSTLSNLTALWVARELAEVDTVVASEEAHISISKAANILGLKFHRIRCGNTGRLEKLAVPSDLSSCCLVLTAGTTSSGAIDDLGLSQQARWTHVDAAWAGALRISPKYGSLLDGIQNADSISISGHKWFFQPKDSGILLFKHTSEAHLSISSNAGYLSNSNIGIMGSRGANGLPLLATLMAWGKNGLVERLERCMELAEYLYDYLNQSTVTIYSKPTTGVLLWHPKKNENTKKVFQQLPKGCASLTTINGTLWIRHVAANPNLDSGALCAEIEKVL